MFFFLSKIMQYAAMPLLWIVVLLVFSLFSKKQLRKRKALAAAVMLLLFFTNPFLANEVLLAWEPGPVLMAKVGNYDAGIVLTGITEVNKSPHDRVHYNEGSERILEAVQLYKMGKIKQILISGGSGAIKEVARTEAENLQHTALFAGVPAKAILVEQESRNTRENAQNTKALLGKQPEIQKLLLITSAFHMPRAKGCFEKVGVAVDPFPVDFHSHDRSFYLDDLLIPSVEALHRWTSLIHEWIGVVVYKVLGYTWA